MYFKLEKQKQNKKLSLSYLNQSEFIVKRLKNIYLYSKQSRTLLERNQPFFLDAYLNANNNNMTCSAVNQKTKHFLRNIYFIKFNKFVKLS